MEKDLFKKKIEKQKLEIKRRATIYVDRKRQTKNINNLFKESGN